MSTGKQILAMLRSRAEGDEETFLSIALQAAASEARQGRRETADEMRTEIDRVRARGSRGLTWISIIGAADGLSQAEIVSATDDAVKTASLDERNEITSEDIVIRLRARQAMRTAFLDVTGQ